jgi:histidinol-phosphate phosphatase family protein
MKGRAAVFIDRDGTVNRDVPYCSHPDQFELLPGAAEGIRLLNESGFRVIVVTNQSGIGRGYFTEETLGKIHERMAEKLAQFGAHVDAIYYCPHHPDDHCQCRKPLPQMILRAASDMGIDMGQSYTIGDSDRDIDMGRRARCKATVKVAPEEHPAADHNAANILEAARWVLDHEAGSH